MINTPLYDIRQQFSSYSVSAIERALNAARLGAFDYLQKRQKELVNMQREDFAATQFQLVNKKELPNGTVRMYRVSLVNSFVTGKALGLFSRSPLFDTPISPTKAFENRSVLPRAFMAFIGGYYVDYLDIVQNDTETLLQVSVYTGTGTAPTHTLPVNMWDAIVNTNTMISLLTFPTTSFGIYETNRYVLQKYVNGLSLDRFNLAGKLSSDTEYLTFVRDEKFLYASTTLDTDTLTTNALRFNSDPATAGKLIHLNVFGIPDLYDVLTVPANRLFVQIDGPPRPIHPDNLIPFTRDALGNKYFAHHIKPVVHYPNVVELVGKKLTETVDLYVMYAEDASKSSPALRDTLSLFHAVNPNKAELYAGSNVPALIKGFAPPTDWKYDVFPFLESLYTIPEEYKVRTLDDWIAREPEVQSLLIEELYQRRNKLYIDCSGMSLSSKVRSNNFTEITTVAKRVTFTEPHYVFTFKADTIGKWEYVRTHVDGYMKLLDKYYVDNGNSYLYVPTRLVTAKTMIELHKLHAGSFALSHTFTAVDEEVTMQIKKGYHINAKDVFATLDVPGKEGDYFIDMQAFDIIIKNRDGVTVVMGKDKRFLMPKDGMFKLKLKDSTYVGQPLTFHVYKNRTVNTYTPGLQNNPMFTLKNAPNAQTMLMYTEDGACLPHSTYYTWFSTRGEETTAVPDVYRQGNTKFIIESTGDTYRTVYETDEMSPDGVLDLTDYLTKPFNLKWHDIYVNGQKVHVNQVLVLSPTLIVLHHIQSRQNVTILEWNMDEDMIQLNPAAARNHPLYKMWMTDTLYRLQVQQAYGVVDDVINTTPDLLATRIHRRNVEETRLYHRIRKLTENGIHALDPRTVWDHLGTQHPLLHSGGVVAIRPDSSRMLEPTTPTRVMKLFPT